MSPANGHAQQDTVPHLLPRLRHWHLEFFRSPAERIKELVAALEVAFDPS